MKRTSKFAIVIGVVNVLIVISYLIYLDLFNYKEAPESAISIMDTYIKYSPILSALSFALMVKQYRKITLLNALVNVGYVGAYIVAIWLLRYLSQGI